MAREPGDDDEEVKLPDDEEEGDAGRDDDEGGDEAEAGQEPEDAQAEEGPVDKQPSRQTRRVQELRRVAQEQTERAQEQTERAARFERELAEERARRAQPQFQQESPEQEQARLALMTTEERIEYRLNKAEQRHQREMNVTRFQAADMADRAAYESKAAYEPRFKKYASEVETLLRQERQAGRDFPRETILSFVLGQKVLQGERSREAAAKAGKDRIKAQTTRADSGRSDRAAPRERTGQGDSIRDLERRLEGRFI
jgi:hypothetical protein